MTPAPAWFRELQGTLTITPQFVLEGDVHDRYLLPDSRGVEVFVPTIIEAIWLALAPKGYEALIVADPVDGVRCHPDTPAARAAAGAVLGREVSAEPAARSMDDLRVDLLRVARGQQRVAIVFELASRLATTPERPDPQEQQFFVAAERMALVARPLVIDRGDAQIPLFNCVVYVVDRDRDLPAWLVAHEDHVRTIAIPRPDFGQRERCARKLLAGLPGWDDATAGRRDELTGRLVSQTDGMTLRSLFSIALLAMQADQGLDDVEDAARAYRVGVLDNPWATADLKDRLMTAEAELNRRVLGQARAVRRALDIMVRAATGLTGAHASPHGTRPRGTLFFAGATGVGKTELAKQLTRLLFGDQHAYIRFDMSEFSAEHAADRLLGAPPGYVGYAAGGELTNAIRERPFSLVLFDEIEKAHPRILDKFLQILEDGRLTDGRGATVYFTEAVLVFTSNLGMWVTAPDGSREANVTRNTEPSLADERIRAEIKRHFVENLERPELLNRLGDSIVVFDFINEATAAAIMDLQIGNLGARLEREHQTSLELSADAREQLLRLAVANLDNGGRGVGTVIETALVNPLARRLFSDAGADDVLVVKSIVADGRDFEVQLA